MNSTVARWREIGLALLLGAFSCFPPTAGAQAGAPIAATDPADTTERLIVKLRNPAERDPPQRFAEIGGRFGERLIRGA